jgi:DNA-binding response OmpR family regulator
VVLAVDPVDGPAMRTLLGEYGYDVRIVDTIEEALIALKQIKPNLVILDYAPDQAGFLLLPKLGGVPAIVCSAEDSVAVRVTSLHLGADDFIPKPYDPYEFVERVKAVLRRSMPRSPRSPEAMRPVQIADLCVDPLRHRVIVRDQEVNLTPTEFTMLTMLAAAVPSDEGLSYNQISEFIWGIDDGETHLLHVHIGRLRHKLTAAGMTNPKLITDRSRGYRLFLEGDT